MTQMQPSLRPPHEVWSDDEELYKHEMVRALLGLVLQYGGPKILGERGERCEVPEWEFSI